MGPMRRPQPRPQFNGYDGGGRFASAQVMPRDNAGAGFSPRDSVYSGYGTKEGFEAGQSPLDFGGPPVEQGPGNLAPPYYQGGDAYDRLRNSGQFIRGRGDEINAGVQGDMNRSGWWRDRWRDEGRRSYDPIASGQGGFRPDEVGRIHDDEALQGLLPTPEELAAAGYSQDEIEQIMGNPDEASRWFDPETLSTIQQQREQHAVEGFNDMSGRVRAGVNPDRLRSDPRLGENVRGANDDYDRRTRGTIQGAGFGPDQGFIDKYRMTPEMQRDIEHAQVKTVGDREAERRAELKSVADASGLSAPLALAAATDRSGRKADADAYDAALNARIATGREAAGREETIEGMRQAGERSRVGYTLDSEDRGAGRRVASEFGVENARRAGEESAMDAVVRSELGLGDRRQEMVRNIGDSAQDTFRYIGDRGYETARDRDETRSRRAQGVADQRTAAARWASGERYDRGVGVSDRRSGRTVTTGNARRQDEQEYRQWLAGQQGMENDNYNQGRRNQITNYGTQTGAINQNDRTYSDYDQARRFNPGRGERWGARIFEATTRPR